MNKTVFSDELLRRAFDSLSIDAVPRADCPEPERLWSAARGELTSAECRLLVAHVASCASCAKDWRLAREWLDDQGVAPTIAPTTDRKAVAEGFGRSRPWFWGLAAAAVIVLALAIDLLRPAIVNEMPAVDPTYREARGQEIRSLLDDAPLSRADPRLRWTPGAEGSRYHLLITTSAFEVIYEKRDLMSAEAVIPVAIIEPFDSGAELLWRVEIEGPDGGRVSSPTFTVVLE